MCEGQSCQQQIVVDQGSAGECRLTPAASELGHASSSGGSRSDEHVHRRLKSPRCCTVRSRLLCRRSVVVQSGYRRLNGASNVPSDLPAHRPPPGMPAGHSFFPWIPENSARACRQHSKTAKHQSNNVLSSCSTTPHHIALRALPRSLQPVALPHTGQSRPLRPWPSLVPAHEPMRCSVPRTRRHPIGVASSIMCCT